jgi:hypothetical protein
MREVKNIEYFYIIVTTDIAQSLSELRKLTTKERSYFGQRTFSYWLNIHSQLKSLLKIQEKDFVWFN